MKSLIIVYISIFCLLNIQEIHSQTTMQITGGELVQVGGTLVVKDAKLVNNGTLTSSDGAITITGTTTDANSSLSGTGTTNLYDLTINKSSNNVEMDKDITVNNTLTLTSGLLNIKTSNLTIAPGGSTTGASNASYVQTSSTGTLIQTVENTDITFPVGKASYTPATLNNAGVSDVFSLRVNDEVRTDDTSGDIVASNNVDLTWYVNETTEGGSDVTLTLQWNPSDELTGFDRTNCFVSHYDGADWSDGVSDVASGADPYSRSLSNVTDFSPFTVTSDINVLPVELLAFTAKKQGKNALLEWVTATEINNDYFDVEWSRDGERFEYLGTVRGAGNTTEEQRYDLLHHDPEVGLNYYRLKQVDFDGTFQYSDVRVLRFTEDNLITRTVDPNPADDYLIIYSDIDNENYMIFDNTGKLVQKNRIPSSRQVDVSHLPPGSYYIKVGGWTKKIIII